MERERGREREGETAIDLAINQRTSAHLLLWVINFFFKFLPSDNKLHSEE